jgi:hypothetical protein
MIVARTRRYHQARARRDARSAAWFARHKDLLRAVLLELIALPF